MMRKSSILLASLLLTFIIACLPIFPYLSEFREIYETGESLFQEWRFVSMPEFYESAHYARLGWLDSTWNYYLMFTVVNHAILLVIFLFVRKILSRVLNQSPVSNL